MCMVCGTTGGCRSACPEYVEPEAEKIGECCECGEPIEEGEEHFNIDGTLHHYDCFCDKYLIGG